MLAIATGAGSAEAANGQSDSDGFADGHAWHETGPQPAQIAMHEILPGVTPKSRPGDAFRYLATIDVTEIYDDNVFSTANRRKSDYITQISPSLVAESNWKTDYLRWQASGEFARYLHNEGERFDDPNISAEGRLDLSAQSNLFGGVWLGRDHEERESPDDVHGTRPTRYVDLRTYWGAYHRFDAVSIKVGGRVERLNYEDVPSTTGEINNDDRDRMDITAGTRIGYRTNEVLELFARGSLDARRYDDGADDNGFRRSSLGYRAAVGVTINSSSVRSEIFAGYIMQDYEDSRLRDVWTPAVGAALQWSVTARTEISLSLDRFVEETTLPLASASVHSSVGIRVKHRIVDRVTVYASLAGSDHAFRGIGRDDMWLSSSVAASLRLTDNLSLTAEYNRMRLVSTADDLGLVRNRFHLSATAFF